MELDRGRNQVGETVIYSDISRVWVMAIKTNEEFMIASHVCTLLSGNGA